MKIKKIYFLLLALLSLFVLSCKENPNDWDYDESYDRLFRTTYFSSPELGPTSILLRYFGVTDATKYVFEFSEGDSMEFTNIVRTDEVLVDTLTPYAEGTNITQTEFRTMFEDLKGTTRYSVRMKAVNESQNIESGYYELSFITPNEQIFTKYTSSVDKVTVAWNNKMNVTHLAYWKSADGEEAEMQTLQLNAQQKANGQATISDLLSGTSYVIRIYNEETRRGEYSVKTLGIATGSGGIIELKSADAGTFNTLLTESAASGVTVLAIVFTDSDQVYEIGKITIPTGIDSLYFVGNISADGKLPELFITRVEMANPMSLLAFQGIDLNSNLDGANYLFDVGNTNCFKNILFSGCTMRNIGRSLVRLNNEDLVVESIIIDDCLLNNIGSKGYGMFNFGKDMSVGLIAIHNSTITEFGSDRLMHLKGGIGEINIDKCIFCNYTSKSSEIFRFDKEPGRIDVTNCIFTGTNGGSPINSGRSDYSAYLEFYGCFLTSDFTVKDRVFTNATILDITSEEMFVDPTNGDFHLKEGVRFAGEKVVGDPRWW